MEKIFLKKIILTVLCTVFISVIPAHILYAAPLTYRECILTCTAPSSCFVNSASVGYECVAPPAGTPAPPIQHRQVWLDYVPLEPLNNSLVNANAGGMIQGIPIYGGLAEYLNYLFPVIITIGAILGVLFFTAYGIEYMTSSSTSIKLNAKSHLFSVVYGLALLISSVLILETINPALTNLNIESLTGVAKLASPPPTTTPPTTTPPTTPPPTTPPPTTPPT